MENVRKCAQICANVHAKGGKLCKRRVKLAHLARALCHFVSYLEPRKITLNHEARKVNVGKIGRIDKSKEGHEGSIYMLNH